LIKDAYDNVIHYSDFRNQKRAGAGAASSQPAAAPEAYTA